MKREDSMKQAMGGVTIKTEPGTSATVMQRLPSLRPPRDLALSAYSQKSQAKNKKVYIPNLNVQRHKPSETVTIKSEPGVKPNASDSQSQTSVRGRGRGKRQILQMGQGLFAEGIPGQKNVGRGRLGGGGGDKTDNMLRKPTLKLKENLKIDKVEEENTVKQLLRDDFVDDPNLEPDFEHCPIILPLLNCKEDPGLKKKSDQKPVIKKEFHSISDMLPEGPEPVDPAYILLQLPDSMPGLSKPEDTPPHPPHATTSSQSTSQSDEAKVEAENERCQLRMLPGGVVGKLQILKSGRARIVLGQTKLWLEMCTPVSFRQELISVKLDKETHSGDMIGLGPVSLRMMTAPDFESIIAATPPASQSAQPL